MRTTGPRAEQKYKNCNWRPDTTTLGLDGPHMGDRDKATTVMNQRTIAPLLGSRFVPVRLVWVTAAGDTGSLLVTTTRTKRQTLTFRHPFSLKGVDRQLAPGEYEVVTDEELLEGLSFPVYRRVATMIFVPADSRGSAIEMVTIDPVELEEAQARDAASA